MAQAAASVDLPVPADRVWALIGGFGSLPDWLPYIPRSELSEGGRVRPAREPGRRGHSRTADSLRSSRPQLQLRDPGGAVSGHKLPVDAEGQGLRHGIARGMVGRVHDRTG